jgi:hypothetical protein
MNNPAEILAKKRIPNLLPYQQAHSPGVPDWCGHCNRGEQPRSLLERLVELPDGRDIKCPDCHPGARRAAA